MELNKEHVLSQLRDAFSLLIDLVIFFALSTYYMAETIFLTLLPASLRPLKDVTGQVVVVTGGGSGVGRLLAVKLARLGCRVVIWDISKEGIAKTCEIIKTEGYESHGYVCDVSDRMQVYRLAEKVKEEVGPVDIIINNAGTVCGRTFLDLPDSAIENTYKVNILSHYWTVKAFLPAMLEARQGHIVTLGSVAGLLGVYGCTDYSATKAAAIAFHESLYSELRAHGHDYIHLTLVCPSFINTGMFHGVTPRLQPMLEPDYVADAIISSLRKNEVNCTLPHSIRMFLPLKCLLPAKTCWELMNRIIRGPETMMEFKGRPRVAAG